MQDIRKDLVEVIASLRVNLSKFTEKSAGKMGKIVDGSLGIIFLDALTVYKYRCSVADLRVVPFQIFEAILIWAGISLFVYWD